MSTKDTYQERRKALASMTDEQLKERFWELTKKIVDPLVDLARTHTSPSIERSVLLRCGVSSPDAATLVNLALKYKVLGHGVAHMVLKLSQKRNISFIEAATIMKNDQAWQEVI